ncbi:MAG TPA: SAF domain-containing protein [Anaeromyxobacteraceae bacterium]|nr:SAF domain-containing protein [Anaeromyxobacteraceae bacterium]
MNLHALLLERAAAGRPLRAALIGAGKFGSMWLSRVPRTPGLHLVGVADLRPDRAREALDRVGWPAERSGAASLEEAARRGTTFVTDDAEGLIASGAVEVVVDATGSPSAGVRHALACCRHGKHVVMVNVEADALCGPLLARRAREAGVVYSLAYGDQPALICEMVDWARAAGLEVVAAGKGTKYLPGYHRSTPETVWGHYGFTEEQVAAGDFNAQMFNSFLDGTKSAIEMAAVANATGLLPAPEGLSFPPCGVDDLPRVLRPRQAGGQLHHAGQVEVISSLERDGRPVFRDLRWGVFVAFAADSDYVARCFREYGLVTDDSGRHAAMYKPFHLIGLELGISVASAGLRREPTGCPRGWLADAVATAKRDLAAGEVLDGEGGFRVYGRLRPAADSLRAGALPIGLAHGVRLRAAVAQDQAVRWADVEVDPGAEAVRLRREMESSAGA